MCCDGTVVAAVGRRWFPTVLVGVCLAAVIGCGPAGPKTYPVKGKVVYKGGDVRQLLYYQVQLEREPDGKQKAVGEIEEDGNFALMSNVEGQGRTGAPEGSYRARILPPSDRADGPKQARKLLHPRYFSFASSELKIVVPSGGEITLELEKPSK